MASRQTFNYDEFLAEFRAACAQHGIDPLTGATGYQVVHLVVDRRRAQWNPQQNHWWRHSYLWNYAPPHHSSTEYAVIRHLYRTTYRQERRRWRRQAMEVT